MTEPDTLNPPATGDEPDLMKALAKSLEDGADEATSAGDPANTRRKRPARSNGAPATTYAYNVYLDGEGIHRVGSWEAQNAGTVMFCSEALPDDDGLCARGPHESADGDLRLIATVDAATNDKAVALILKGEAEGGYPFANLTDRGQVVRQAHMAFIDLHPIAIPVSRVETGRVPCPWRVERSCTIGGGR